MAGSGLTKNLPLRSPHPFVRLSYHCDGKCNLGFSLHGLFAGQGVELRVDVDGETIDPETTQMS